MYSPEEKVAMAVEALEIKRKLKDRSIPPLEKVDLALRVLEIKRILSGKSEKAVDESAEAIKFFEEIVRNGVSEEQILSITFLAEAKSKARALSESHADLVKDAIDVMKESLKKIEV